MTTDQMLILGAGIIAIIIIFIVAIVKIYDHKITDKVLSNSERIRKLNKVNKDICFHPIKSSLEISKHYDNKTNFNKIEPAFLMTAEIRNNIEKYAIYCEKIRENQDKFIQYKDAVNEIATQDFSVDYNAIGVPENIYKLYENKLFAKGVIRPVTNCTFNVTMTYSSPKGKVNLSKSDCFGFNDVFACLESVSRSRLDRSTYLKMAAVERGDVSDSLRYDVLNRDNFTCVICGASARQGARLHIDHIIPIAKGGKSTLSNLQTLCERCNIGKSDKTDTQKVKEKECLTINNLTCEKCGGQLILRNGKYGDFYGCSNYPKCRFTKQLK